MNEHFKFILTSSFVLAVLVGLLEAIGVPILDWIGSRMRSFERYIR